ncbi:porin [Amantichitinum ursilacus]|uniref:Major outer membrane protein P.IB n=1 Tax=Amantichitinum ursilacus TaxID=857265 RepID=A0A0N0XIV6_9NEIS|nr:porin [Amantichitinum ursilacus]KPC53090.1 Major outer membrane protein P.IB precursor [Amantichitinum ursilacus]
MKTKYIAVAISLALGAGAAFADVTIDGNVEGGVQWLKAGDSKAAGITYDAVIGVSGTDKLDAGGKLIWRVEQEVLNTQSGRTQGGQSNWGNRQAYIGLSGDYGTFRSGNITTPSYDTLDTTYGDTGAEWLARDYGFGQSNYARSTFRYDTPEFYGLQASAAYLMENQSKSGNKGYDIAANYKWNGLGVQGTYQRRFNIDNNDVLSDGINSVPAAAGTSLWGNAATTGPDSTNWYAGANYKFGDGFGLGGGFKRAQLTNDGSEIRQDMWLAQGTYQYGKHGFYLTYFNLGNVKGQGTNFTNGGEIGDSGSQAVDARYNYNLSKHSIAFVDARYVKNDDNGSVSADNDAFYTGSTGSNGAGQNSYRVMGGLKTWF